MLEMKVMGIALDTRSGSPIVVLNDIEKGDDFVNGIDEGYQSVHDARVLMTSVKYALMGQGQEATNILFRNFGDEMAMRYLQF
jgi:hypothetical protein